MYDLKHRQFLVSSDSIAQDCKIRRQVASISCGRPMVNPSEIIPTFTCSGQQPARPRRNRILEIEFSAGSLPKRYWLQG